MQIKDLFRFTLMLKNGWTNLKNMCISQLIFETLVVQGLAVPFHLTVLVAEL